FRSPKFWLIAAVASSSQGSFLAIQTLWSGPWLRDVAGLDPEAVAHVLLISACGFIAGNIAIGLFAVWVGRRGVPTPVVLMFGMALFMLVQLAIVLGWTDQTGILWFLFGFTGTTGILAFAVLTRVFPITLAGRASTAMNLLLFVAAFAMQWSIGIVIDMWPVTDAGGYHPQGYQVSFAAVLVVQVITFGVLLFGHRALVPDGSEAR
ncbi:MAG: MFS transporter, partial [Alphaproteobacteria bacterium]